MKGLLLRSISIVLIRPKTAVQEKALTLGGATGFQIIWWGKEELELGKEDSVMKKDLEENLLKGSRVQTILSILLVAKNISLKELRRVETN